MVTILIVDDDRSLGYSFKSVLESNYQVDLAENSKEAIKILEKGRIDLCLLDYKLGAENGLELLSQIKKDWPELKIIMMTAFGSSEVVLESIKRGALDYLVKPIELGTLEDLIQKHTFQEPLGCKAHTFSINNEIPLQQGLFIGSNFKVNQMLKQVALVAPTNTPVLLTGESGTGKELIAKMLHEHSERKNHPYVVINCAAIPETLLESELFGHQKGAFSGATENRKGKFEFADGGTLFLDEIGDTPLNIQAKMLRVLQEGTIERLGDNHQQKVDVRVISATNQDLLDKIEGGNFRSDLFFRLNGMNIQLPPLRERRDDLKDLLIHFTLQYSKEIEKKIDCIDNEVVEILKSHDWPGNVRELQNKIRQAVILSKDTCLTPEQFSRLKSKISVPLHQESKNGFYNIFRELFSDNLLNNSISMVEKELIEGVLQRCNFQLAKAALELGITRVTLNAKIKKYQISKI